MVFTPDVPKTYLNNVVPKRLTLSCGVAIGIGVLLLRFYKLIAVTNAQSNLIIPFLVLWNLLKDWLISYTVIRSVI